MNLHTATLFDSAPRLQHTIQRNGVRWLDRNRAMVESWAADQQINPDALQAAIDSDLESPVVSRQQSAIADLTVVITCHNYERFLGDALDSIRQSAVQPSRVIVIDDASDVPLRGFEISNLKFQIEFHRVEFKNVHRARGFGLDLVKTKYVLMLDGDNMIHSDYIDTAIDQLEADRNAAFVFPVLLKTSEDARRADAQPLAYMYGTDKAPEIVRAEDIERQNVCDANGVYRAEVLRQSLAFQISIESPCYCHDWRVARNVLRMGGFHALKSKVPLYYRTHPQQMTRNVSDHSYFTQAGMAQETVTLIIAFSGRWEAWKKLRQWIITQSWPAERLRLFILNSSHQHVSVSDLGLEHLELASMHIERIDAGRPRLGDERRDVGIKTRQDVECAVASLYNRAICMTAGQEYLMFVEDDVIPQRLDAIDRLLRSMGPNVAAVSGLYRHRYQGMAVAFRLPRGDTACPLLPLEGPEIETVVGTGFGCLMARRSVLSRYALSGDDAQVPHYDGYLCNQVYRSGLLWILDRGVQCEHLINN